MKWVPGIKDFRGWRDGSGGEPQVEYKGKDDEWIELPKMMNDRERISVKVCDTKLFKGAHVVSAMDWTTNEV